jgi:hypothetical protein
MKLTDKFIILRRAKFFVATTIAEHLHICRHKIPQPEAMPDYAHSLFLNTVPALVFCLLSFIFKTLVL